MYNKSAMAKHTLANAYLKNFDKLQLNFLGKFPTEDKGTTWEGPLVTAEYKSNHSEVLFSKEMKR